MDEILNRQKDSAKKYYQKNKVAIIAKNTEYNQKNRERYLAYQKEYYKKKKMSNNNKDE
jgi:hypothetical protein